jgi:hypothetical protein
MVLEYLLQKGQVAAALMVVRNPKVPRALAYKHAPAMLAANPAATVDAWLTLRPTLEPRFVSRTLCLLNIRAQLINHETILNFDHS